MNAGWTKWVAVTMTVCMTLSLCSCGTIFYPERKGQESGDIDLKVAILDGIGLLFFLVPGVIAFAFDFNNGTIYLPPGQSSMLGPVENIDDMIAVKISDGPVTVDMIEAAIEEYTGKSIDLSRSDVQIVRTESSAGLHGNQMVAQVD